MNLGIDYALNPICRFYNLIPAQVADTFEKELHKYRFIYIYSNSLFDFLFVFINNNKKSWDIWNLEVSFIVNTTVTHGTRSPTQW